MGIDVMVQWPVGMDWRDAAVLELLYAAALRVAELCGCTVADMDEAIYGIRYTIRFDAGGRAQLAESRD